MRKLVILLLIYFVVGNTLRDDSTVCLVPQIRTEGSFWHGVYEDYSNPDIHHNQLSIQKLVKYRKFLVTGTLKDQDWNNYGSLPLNRFDSMKKVLGEIDLLYKKTQKKISVVEVGTSRSFTHGGIAAGCNTDDKSYWHKSKMEDWDWGAGSFTRVTADCLSHIKDLSMFTVDLMPAHIERCRHMNEKDFPFIKFVVSDSQKFLSDFQGQIDLLYMDTADVYPIEPSAELHLNEAKIVVDRNLIADGGYILIDDVLNQTPIRLGERTIYGKSKYSIPYLLQHGFTMEMIGYQYILRKTTSTVAIVKSMAKLDFNPFRVLHVTYHPGCDLEIRYIAKRLRFHIETQFVTDDHESTKSDGSLRYNMNHERASRIWKKHQDYYSTFDLIIVSDTTALSRIFLQHNWPKKLIIWICNRFDYKHSGAVANKEMERLPYPDPEYFNLLRYAAAMQGPGSGIAIVGYTDFENFYAKSQGVDVGDLLIKPTGYGSELKVPKVSSINSTLDRSFTFFVPPYENDKRTANICKQLGIPCYCGRYAGAGDLKGFLGVLHIPYAWSNLALFEIIRLGLVYFIPTQRLLLSMEEIFWSPPYDRAHLNMSEWYHSENEEYFIYFDQWDELKSMYSNLTQLDRTIKQKRRRNFRTLETRRDIMVQRWLTLTQKI